MAIRTPAPEYDRVSSTMIVLMYPLVVSVNLARDRCDGWVYGCRHAERFPAMTGHTGGEQMTAHMMTALNHFA
jgi:hypothetical protein